MSADARLRPPRRRGDAAQNGRHSHDELPADDWRRPQEAIQLEPLARDRQHQERQPPEDDAKDRRAAKPLHVAGCPRHGTSRHDRDEQRRLPSPHDAEDRDHDEAAGRDQQRRIRAEGTEIQHDRACRDEDRRGISPRGAEADRPLEADERAEKPADHQRPVRDQLILPGQRQIPPEAHEPEPHPAGHRQQSDGQQRQPARRQPHQRPPSPSWRLASSDIMSGSHGGSHSTTMSTSVTSGTRSRIADVTRSFR